VPWLNYHHLLYFYTVAREGSVARAAEVLHLTQPTVSTQIRMLERALGEQLFARRGRGLVLTDAGRLAYRYAEDIFALGREFQDVLGGRPTGRPARLAVGIADAVPKLIAFRILSAVRSLPEPPALVCRDDAPERLLAALAAHELDLVIADTPPGPATAVRVYGHLLGECGVTVFGTPELAGTYRRRFPQSLDGAPFLLPTEHAALRRQLDEWFAKHDIRPRIEAQFADSALLKVFGQAGAGLFAAPSAIEAEVKRQYAVRVVGRIADVRESFYAITAERKVKHPVVARLTELAQKRLFA
jgi:LysR family transcriptional regulator, transcriptional activator of nhaA